MPDKYWSTVHYHPYDWNQVVGTYWKRYPNPNSQHVFSEDIISSKIDEKGRLRTNRLITKTNKLPSWGEHLFSTRRVWLIEESIVDPKKSYHDDLHKKLEFKNFHGNN